MLRLFFRYRVRGIITTIKVGRVNGYSYTPESNRYHTITEAYWKKSNGAQSTDLSNGESFNNINVFSYGSPTSLWGFSSISQDELKSDNFRFYWRLVSILFSK